VLRNRAFTNRSAQPVGMASQALPHSNPHGTIGEKPAIAWKSFFSFAAAAVIKQNSSAGESQNLIS
jgi:hypothetical protein